MIVRKQIEITEFLMDICISETVNVVFAINKMINLRCKSF